MPDLTGHGAAGVGGLFSSLAPTNPDPDLVNVMRQIRQDARSVQQAPEVAQTFNVEFAFGGTMDVPSPGDTLQWGAGRLAGRLVGAEIFANAAGECQIDISIGTVTTWPSHAPVYSAIPALNGNAALELDITDWVLGLQPQDILIGTVITCASPITAVTVLLSYRRLQWAGAVSDVTDNTGTTISLDDGQIVVVRP